MTPMYAAFIVLSTLSMPASAADHRLSLALGYAPDAHTVSFGWTPYWSLANADWLELGTVVRANYFGGRDLSLETAEIAAIH